MMMMIIRRPDQSNDAPIDNYLPQQRAYVVYTPRLNQTDSAPSPYAGVWGY